MTGSLRGGHVFVAKIRQDDPWATTTVKIAVVVRHQGSGQRHRGDAGLAGPTWLPSGVAAAAERPLERPSKLGAERRVEDEVDGAVDYDEQVAQVAADLQPQSVRRRQRSRCGDEVDGVEFEDGLR